MKYSLTKHYKYKLEVTEMRETLIWGFEFNTKYMAMLDNGQLFVKKGYAWDGSSIPFKKTLRFFSFGFYDADRYCKTASLIHDALCQAIREGLIPKHRKQVIDFLYRTMCIEGGLSERRAILRYNALRRFGDVGIEPEKNPRNKIFET